MLDLTPFRVLDLTPFRADRLTRTQAVNILLPEHSPLTVIDLKIGQYFATSRNVL